MSNLLQGRLIKPRVCACCGEAKPSGVFSYSTKYGYAKTCRECGQWLTLFRAHFGKTRDVEANRIKTRLRGRAKRRQGAVNLWQAWMGLQA